MNNEKYNQIIDKAYKNYKVENQKLADVIGHGFHGGRLTQEEFTNKIKTDDEFSKTWNLKIEERELSLEDRRKEMESIGVDFVTINMFFNKTLDLPKQEMYEKKIPTKLITVTYKDETVEIYE